MSPDHMGSKMLNVINTDTNTWCCLLPGAHLQDVLLQGVGLSHASLSKPAADYLSALVDNAMVLGVRDTSLGR